MDRSRVLPLIPPLLSSLTSRVKVLTFSEFVSCCQVGPNFEIIDILTLC